MCVVGSFAKKFEIPCISNINKHGYHLTTFTVIVFFKSPAVKVIRALPILFLAVIENTVSPFSSVV